MAHSDGHPFPYPWKSAARHDSPYEIDGQSLWIEVAANHGMEEESHWVYVQKGRLRADVCCALRVPFYPERRRRRLRACVCDHGVHDHPLSLGAGYRLCDALDDDGDHHHGPVFGPFPCLYPYPLSLYETYPWTYCDGLYPFHDLFCLSPSVYHDFCYDDAWKTYLVSVKETYANVAFCVFLQNGCGI